MLNLDGYSNGVLQDMRSLLKSAISAKIDIDSLIYELDKRFESNKNISMKLNVNKKSATFCSICGKPAVILPVNTNNGNRVKGDFNYVKQCQNRPGLNSPWKKGHCGHSEYIKG